MNIVLVKHNKVSKTYTFSVSEELAPYIKKGMGVLCATMRGIEYGVAASGLICGEGALDVALANGAYLPLKPIVGIEHPALAKSETIRKVVTDEILEKIAVAFKQPSKARVLA